MSTLLRIVLVGHGMVGSRFATDLAAACALTGRQVTVTVLGQERHEPYNRTMLTGVLAGRAGEDLLGLPSAVPAHWRVLPATMAERIDRRAAVVIDSDGGAHPYDTLVLATGAVPEPVGPAVRLAAGSRPVHRLHTLDDLRGLIAAMPEARSAAVLGAGPLGIEVACALRMRGLEVTLIEREAQVLPGLLDAESARVVQATLDDLGICVHLANSELTQADLVVACTGIRPQIALALDAGLPVEGGILVNDDLISTADPRIAAIGDCARPVGGVQGLVEPGWDQARRLAQLLAGMPSDEVRVLAPRHIVRLHTPGLDVAVMGEKPRPDGAPGSDPGRVVSLLDPQARRALRLVVRLGRLVGATAVGAPGAAPDLIVAHRNQTPVPADPAQLVIKGVPARQTFPERSSGPFVAPVCRCNSVSAAAITEAFEAGARDVGAIATATRATTGCGGCTEKVCSMLDSLRASSVSS